jgi:hypothetical protein
LIAVQTQNQSQLEAIINEIVSCIDQNKKSKEMIDAVIDSDYEPALEEKTKDQRESRVIELKENQSLS